MSLFSFGQGITLKELLENPKLQNPPQINRDENKTSKKVDDLTDGIDLSSAFLGPNLWGSQNMGNGNNNDFNLEYMDLDEFLCENGIPIGFDDGSNSSIQENKNSKSISPPPQENLHISAGLVSDPLLPQKVSPILRNPSPVTTMSPHSPEQNTTSPQSNEETRAKGDHSTAGSHSPVIEYTVPDTDLALASIPASRDSQYSFDSDDTIMHTNFHVDQSDIKLVTVPGQGNFDPCRRKFSEEELKPQPIIKKSRKVYVPEDCKDDKYWCRRKKNNVAAKRSRDARRIKENQIAMRAAFLEQENSVLREELKKVKDENKHLKASLKKYET